jgi:hypothetical protein
MIVMRVSSVRSEIEFETRFRPARFDQLAGGGERNRAFLVLDTILITPTYQPREIKTP